MTNKMLLISLITMLTFGAVATATVSDSPFASASGGTDIAVGANTSSAGLVDSNGRATFSYGGYYTGGGAGKMRYYASDIRFVQGSNYGGSYVLTVFDSTGGNTPDQKVALSSIQMDVSVTNKYGRYLIREKCDDVTHQWYASDRVLLDGASKAIGSPLQWYAIDSTSNTAINGAIAASTTTFPGTLTFAGSATDITGIIIDGGGVYFTDSSVPKIEGFLWNGADVECGVTVDLPPEVSIPAVDPVYIQSYIDNGTVDLTAVIGDELVTVENGPNDLTISWAITASAGGSPTVTANPVNNDKATAVFDTLGFYTVEVSVDDGVNAAVLTDVVIEVINNAAPFVNAGPATATVYLSDGGILALGFAEGVRARDDGEPLAGTPTVGWTSDIGGVAFDGTVFTTLAGTTADPLLDTDPVVATFSATGTYVITLTMNDSDLSASDSMTVTVEQKPLTELVVEEANIDDTYVDQGSPDDNEGASTKMKIKNSETAAQKAYLRFDTGGPISGNIRSAELRLNGWGSGRNAVEATDSVFAVTYGENDPWIEGNGIDDTLNTIPGALTWNNDDLVWGDELDSRYGILLTGSSDYYYFDVTDFVAASDGTINLGITTDLTSGGTTWRSSDDNRPPVLTIMYDPNGAVDISPKDNSGGFHTYDAPLIWREVNGATAHDVYFGTVSGALDFKTTIDASAKTPGIDGDPNTFEWNPVSGTGADGVNLELGGTYHWRIDEVVSGNTSVGEEWSFTVVANNPDIPVLWQPVDVSTKIDPVSFTWRDGYAAALSGSHDLYLGTSMQDVNDMVVSANSDKFSSVVSGVEITNLNLDTQYFFKVVANASGESWESDLRSFTTNTFSTIEGFNDGVADWTVTGGPTADVNSVIVSSELVMEITYDDEGGVQTEASIDLSSNPLNLSSDTGRAALTFRIYGTEGNVQEDMYITLASAGETATVAALSNDGTAIDLTGPLYKGDEMIQMRLADFTDSNPGLDLTAITGVTVGFGDGVDNNQSGVVYIENIRTHMRRCQSWSVDGDIVDGDCTAGPNDLAVLASDWLETETVVTATPALTDGLIVQFDFEEVVDTNTPSSVTYDGANYASAKFVDTPSIVYDAERVQNVINMGGIGHVTINDSSTVLASLTNELTISLWCYGNADLGGEAIVNSGCFRADTVDSNISLYSRIPNTSGEPVFTTSKMGGSHMSWSDSTFEDWNGAWNHYAFVVDASNNLQAIYCNGVMVARESADMTGYSFDVAGLEKFDIGMSPEYHGKIDDFRIYNRALSSGEILSLGSTTVTSYTQKLTTASDINEDGVVNLVDLEEVVSIWLVDEILWPEL